MKQKDKIEIYENFLHKINLFIVSGNNDGIAELIRNADIWSYAHRVGENISDRKRDKMILDCLKKLCDTPNADKATMERQKRYTEAKKNENK